MRVPVTLALQLAVVAALALQSGSLGAQSVPGGDVERGRAEYMAYGCFACHGTTGAGGGWQGPRVAPIPLPFPAFLAQLREPADKMPRYAEVVLTEQQARDMHAYLASIQPGPPAAEIRLLRE